MLLIMCIVSEGTKYDKQMGTYVLLVLHMHASNI